MDLAEVVGHATVVAGQPHVAVPAGGAFEVPGALGKALQALILIDLDAQPQCGDLHPSQASVRVKEAVRQGKLSG